MKIRRWSIVGLVAASLLTSGVSACKMPGAEPKAAGSASPTAASDDPKQALLDSTKEISKGNFRYSMTADGSTGGGVVHMPSKSAQLKLTFAQPGAKYSMDMDFIYIEPDSWVRLKFNGTDLSKIPGLDQLNTGKYMHLDQTKAKDIKDLRFDFSNVDPAGSTLLTKSVTDVKKTGEGSYAGTIDVSKAGEATMIDPQLVTALGVQANSLPFTAKVDPQGRLSQFTVQVPATQDSKAHELTVSYSDYDAASQPAKPATTDTVEAPQQVYDYFNK
ncbi:hypothetical protein [Micromonospora zhanjiangensis]|uniref:Lipoprotein n=1 Tax=Micromonospora zhanjiangensis TaxID=1522057 RepID=A0ABV8KL55_9ACTN